MQSPSTPPEFLAAAAGARSTPEAVQRGRTPKPEIISTRADLDEFYRLDTLRLESQRRHARRAIGERLGLDPATAARLALTYHPPLDPAAYVGLECVDIQASQMTDAARAMKEAKRSASLS